MSRYIKVSAISGSLCHSNDPGKSPQQLVEKVKAFWQRKLEAILPDKPDFIVLPECCDINCGLSREQSIEYSNYKGNQMRDFLWISQKRTIAALPIRHHENCLTEPKEILPGL